MTFSNSSLARKATVIALAQPNGQDIILKPISKGKWIINAPPGDYDLTVKATFGKEHNYVCQSLRKCSTTFNMIISVSD